MISHYGFDTVPRVVPSTVAGLVDLVVPFRLDGDDAAAPVAWTLHAEVDGRPVPTRGRAITAGFIGGLRRQMQQGGMFDFARLPPYLDMEAGTGSATYVEARVPRLVPGSPVTYRLDVTHDGPQVHSSDTFTTYAIAPTFGRADIRRVFAADVMKPRDAWVLYHRRVGDLHCLRVDVAALKDEHTIAPGGTAGGLVDLVVTAGGRQFDLNRPRPDVLPLVDPATDSVTFVLPADGPLADVSVSYHGSEPLKVDVSRTEAGVARVMFVNFAIQGLNDYFATPDSRYPPPRTYTQVTMRDELATFSSRPGSPEDSIGDGYAFTLEAHRRHGVKQMWAMNGGLAMLLAHDSPEDLALLRQDVANGLVVPVVAGFGAHRLPYYSTATNVHAISAGKAVLDGIVGSHSDVYYPDSRLYADAAQVTDALRDTGVEYVVVDADAPFVDAQGVTRHNTLVEDAKPMMNGFDDRGRWVDFLNVWRDRRTGVKVLFIDPQMKDGLFGADGPVAERGKLPLDLREKFIVMAAQVPQRAANLLVYSDDADKASGNGWFDGNPTPMNRNYQAALSWISHHPWVQAVTTDDLDDDDCVGELDLRRASDPYIEKNWRMDDTPSLPNYRFDLAFDAWYARWAPVRVAWLDETLADITRRAEHAIATWPVRNRMVDLAALYLTMCLHESQWSKITRDAGRDPEDFVVAESIQLRNAHVFLAAGVWAEWAASAAGSQEAYRDCGPVVDRVAELETAMGDPPPWRCTGGAGLQWDHDPLPCIVLYNADACVVIDRNGGCIPYVFTVVEGRPYCVSGTFKAYQFLDVDWPTGAGAECDGIVLQNTVHTPNHAYVASDVDAALTTFGQAPQGDGDFDWIHPDNFNVYGMVETQDGPAPSVTLEYGAGTDDARPDTLAELDALFDRDRARKLADGPAAGVVFHDTERFGTFRKTIQLDGATVRVRYSGVRPGHVVANEFCVDLWSCALRGTTQTRTVADDARSVTLANGTPAVDIVLGAGCALTDATRAALTPPTSETLRLHRVMTDNVEIVAAEGGAFDFSIVLRSSTGEAQASGGT